MSRATFPYAKTLPYAIAGFFKAEIGKEKRIDTFICEKMLRLGLVSEMGTPTKSEIYQEAKRLFFQHELRNGNHTSINPEYEELAEDGFIAVAQSNLMSNPETLYGIIQQKAKSEKTEETYCEDLVDFPIDLIMRECGFVVGSRGSGKTNLLKLLVAEALERKIQVKVFDPSLAWKDFPLSSVKVKVATSDRLSLKWNVVYDIARLSVLEARKFVSRVIAEDLKEAIILTDLGKKPSCLVIIEESQNVIPSNSLRSLKFQDISRFVTQGRNFGLSYLCASQRLASVDVNLIEISGVRFWGKLEGHRNLTKARYWLSKYTTWRLRDLKVGQCYLQIGSRVKLLELPEFERVILSPKPL